MPATTSPAPRALLGIVVAALLLGALLAGCSGGSGNSSPSQSAGARAATLSPSGFAGAALPAGISAPGFSLTDQRGQRQSLAAHRGHVTVLSFLYPACGACLLVAQQIRGALDQLSRPPAVLVVSAEPDADTQARAKRFLARVSLGGRAEYLSGTRRRLQPIWRAYHVTPPSVSRTTFERSASVLLIDRQGRERVVFGLEQLTPESLAHDIGKLDGGPAHP
jgi:cytochrome oxidase Cu insertion factor (SCO1/SenC/PrrC family)